MTIQPISTSSLALYLTPADLQERGLCAEELTEENTLALAREAFLRSGLTLREPLEIESYPDKCGLLLFVHLCPPRKTTWFFDDFDAFLAALAFLHTSEMGVSPYWWEERFWITLSGNSDFLSEFGTQETEDPYIQARLREYALPLQPSLHRYF